MDQPIPKYAVLFDIDGTLIATGGAGQHAFLRTFRDEFDIVDPIDGVPFAGRSDRAIATDLMQLNSIDPSEDNWERFRHCYSRHLLDTLQEKQGCMLPGVVELLSQVEAHDHVTLGLITGNMEAGAKAKLLHYGLAERFAFGGYGDHHCDRNDIARTALVEAQRHVESTSPGPSATVGGAMVIGDTVYDIICAHAIGAFAVGVCTGGNSSKELAAAGADLVLDDLSQPERLLAEIHAANVC